MKKHLFITGPAGCGKSTLIKNELGNAAMYAGGFITLKECDNEGKAIGYDLYPASAMVGTAGYDGMRFLDCSVNPPTHDNEVFRGEGARILREVDYYPFTVLDEIGGFEILVPQFRKVLEEVLNNDKPIIGVLKDAKSAEALKKYVGLSDRFSMSTDNLRRVLSADPDTTVVTMHGRNDIFARRAVRQWVKEYINF